MIEWIEVSLYFFFFFQAEDGIRDYKVTGVQTCALPICSNDRVTNAYWPFADFAFGPINLSTISRACCAAEASSNAMVKSASSGGSFCEIGRASCRERV